METRILDAIRDLPGAVAAASEKLCAGEVVALPTETVYGLAADVFQPAAVARIFEAKQRPLFDPLIVHVLDESMWRRVAEPDSGVFFHLIERFWPGPLTLIVPKRPEISELVTAGSPLVALRMPAHPVFRAVLEKFGNPLAAPSANPFGAISPTTAAHVESGLGGRIPLILDAGPAQHGLESTIVYLENDQIHLLRAGPVSLEELAGFGNVHIASKHGREASPGQMASHYAPQKPLRLVDSATEITDRAQSAFLGFSSAAKDFGWTEILSRDGDFPEAAAHLFAALHRLDATGAETIYVEKVPEMGLGRAIMDRLRRAAVRN